MLNLNLLHLKHSCLFLLLIGKFAFSQAVPQAGISSTPADSGGATAICINDAISFTGFGGSLHFTPRSYEFFAVRSGHASPVLLRIRDDAAVWHTTANTATATIQNGDEIFVRAWNTTTASASTVTGTFSDSRRITVTVHQIPAPTLFNDAVNNTFCTGQAVTFGALPAAGGIFNYSFYINDVLMQGPTASDSFGPITTLSDGDVVRVDVLNTSTSCSGSSTLLMHENIVNGGGSIAFSVVTNTLSPQNICNGTSPPQINNVVAGMVSGTTLPANSTSYQWYSSSDASTWIAISNANSQDYQPPVLTTTTYYRRNVASTINGQLCEAVSNILQVWVAPNLLGGTVSGTIQTICEGTAPQGIMVTGGVTGTTVTYQWQSSTDGLNFVDIPRNASAENYQPEVLNQTTFFRRVTSALSGQCSLTSTLHTVNVINWDAGEFDPALNETICYNTKPTNIFSDSPVATGNPGRAATSSNSTLRFEWEQSVNNGSTWTIIPGETLNKYDSPALTQTTWFRRKVIAILNGVSCEAYTQGVIQINIKPDLVQGDISTAQDVCAGAPFNTLTLINATPPAGTSYLYQWQSSPDDITYSNLTGETGTTLSGRVIANDTYYRVLVRYRNTPACEKATAGVLIDVNPSHTLNQVAGTLSPQSVCPSIAMDPIVLEYGGGATGINIPSLIGTGLTFSYDMANKRYTISGTPTTTLTLDFTTTGPPGDVCSPTTFRYVINRTESPETPDFVDINNTRLWSQGAQVGSYHLCYGTATSNFEAEFLNPAASNFTNLDWELVSPTTAGNINRSTGLMTWNTTFSGTATFRVRGQSKCDPNVYSAWSTTFEVVVDPLLLNPTPGSIPGIQVSMTTTTSGTTNGGDPFCEITDQTPDTQYIIPASGGSTAQTNFVFWTASATFIGNPAVPSPGALDIDTGLMDWNTGFWGTVNIYADPSDCSGANDPRSGATDPNLRQTYTVTIPQGPANFVDIFVASSGAGNSLPTCPAETAGAITNFDSNLSATETITWAINNTNAGTIDPLTGILTWSPNFSGHVDIIARTVSSTNNVCPVTEGRILVTIPDRPTITLSSGFNSNIIAACQNTATASITYSLAGGATGATVSGLPAGVTANYTATPQISTITLTGNSGNAGETYSISLPLRNYSYSTAAGVETANTIATQLVNAMAGDPLVNAVVISTGEIQLSGKTAGVDFRVGTQTGGNSPQITFSAVNTTPSTRELVISGTATDTPTNYPFTITTTTISGSSCNQTTSSGEITIRPDAEIMLQSANDGQVVCNNNPIVPIVYSINNASSAFVEVPPAGSLFTLGLPNGVTSSFSNGQLTISGTPQVSITTTTTFVYTVRTQNSTFNCQEDVMTGSIIVQPDLEIRLITPPATQFQQVCVGNAIQNVTYELSASTNQNNANFSFNIAGLPNGVGGTYNAGTRRMEFSGTPDPIPPIKVPTDYSYSLTANSCGNNSQTITGTLRVFPKPYFELKTGVGTDNQTVCDAQAIQEIRYEIVGATGFTSAVDPPANWVQFFHDPVSQQVIIQATPPANSSHEVLYTYTLNPIISPFGCSVVEPITGTIRVQPGQQLSLVSSPTTEQQEICEGTAITPIIYELQGNAVGAQVIGLPAGVGENIKRFYQQMEVQINGTGTVASGENYTLRINNNEYTYQTGSGETLTSLAQGLANLVTTDPAVTATSSSSSRIIITAVNMGSHFRIGLEREVNGSATLTANLLQTHAQLEISGTPNVTSTLPQTFTYSVTTSGGTCSSTTLTGSLRIQPASTLHLSSATGTDNQMVCNNIQINDIVYDVGGQANGVVATGLPNGVTGNFNATTNKFTLSGTPNTNVNARTTFTYTLTTFGNLNSCTEATRTGTIVVDPNESFNLISALQTDAQQVCAGTALVDIVYEFGGGATGATLTSGSFPPGISGNYSPTIQLMEIQVNGSSTQTVTETYTITLNGTAYDFVSTVSGNTPATIATGLVNAINPHADVTATNLGGGRIQLEAKVAGVYFTTFVSQSSNAQLTLGTPTMTTGTGRYIISGTPSGTFTASTTFSYTLTTPGTNCSPISQSGFITVNPPSSINLSSAVATDRQTVCDNTPITSIAYQLSQSASGATITWQPHAPVGLQWNVNSSTHEFEIMGTPITGVSSATSYTYTIQTTGNIYNCNEATVSGTLTVAPTQQIDLKSGNNTDAQTICEGGGGLALTPIVYQLGGNASGATVTGLPAGITSNFNATTMELTISGVASSVSIPTTFHYTVSTSGPNCNTASASGTIRVETLSTLVLQSAVATTEQTGNNAVCDGQAITPIVYRFGGGALGATVTGLPQGLSLNTSNNTFTISGNVNLNNKTPQTFRYTVTTSGNSCTPGVSLSGEIEVISLPQVDTAVINNNDVNHVSCNGSNDGAIKIPSSSPDFDLRISGQQNSIRQVDHVVLTQNPNLSDVYTIRINGTDFSHTVIPTQVGGPVQNAAQAAQALVDVINQATGSNAVEVTATFQTSATVVLTADTAGVPFTVNSVTVNSASPTTATISHTQITANGTSRYSYSWTGPNGFTSSNLSIENLSAGTYELTVEINNCVGNPVQFVITEPQPLSVSTSLCNGAFEGTATGGTAPYTFKLFDSNNALVRTDVTNSAQNYSGLTPGADYVLEVIDSQCAVAVKTAVNIPFRLAFDAAIPVVVDDYCKDSDGDGFIELGNASGLAFSGGSNQFTYSWSGPDGYRANTRDIYNIKDGRYTVTVRDAVLGCSDTQTFTVGTVTALDIDIISTVTTNANGDYTVNLSCATDKTGEIEIQVTGGVSSTGYTYSWTRDGNALPSARSAKLSNLGVGVYVVTVSNAPPSGVSPNLSPCVLTETITVKAPDPIQIVVNSGTGTQTLCPGSKNAEIEIEILGGTPPFKVQLNDGRAGSYTVTDHKPYSIKNLDPSATGPDYKITVEDANSCTPATTSTPTTVTFQGADPVDLRAAVTEIDCVNGKPGSIVLNVVQGKINDPENVQVRWISATDNHYHTWKSNGGKLDNIEIGGIYQVTVTRGDCELYNEKVTINDVSGGQLLVKEPVVNAGSCNGDPGQISLSFEGGFPPYSIKWEQYKIITTSQVSSSQATPSTQTTTLTTTDNTSTKFQWVALPQYINNAIASDLEPGTYRATISDASFGGVSSCGGNNIVTKNLVIGSGVFELINFEVLSTSLCVQGGENTQDVQFTIRNTLPLKNNYAPIIMLDGKILTLTDEKLKKIGSSSYKIIEIEPGDHSINIKTGVMSPVSSSDAQYEDCSIIHPFTIDAGEQLPISFEGETNIIIDPCEAINEIKIDPSQVSGGSPFEIDNSLTYDYQWTFTPSSTTALGNETTSFVGDTLLNVEAGKYELIITDSKGCSSESILFTVSDRVGATPFGVSGALLQTTGTGGSAETTKVKAIGPNCDSATPNGKIGISVSGGIRPYTIQWEKEVLSTNASGTGSDANYVPLPEYKNATQLTNLDSGKYKLILKAQQSECEQEVGPTSKTYYEEIIVVPKREDLYVVEGPFIDTNLCQGKPGKLSLQVFDNQMGTLTFYYNGGLVSVDEEASNSPEGSYTLNITEPVTMGQLLITNAVGCEINQEIILTEIGAPSFEFNSPSLQIDGQILAREEVTFTNTSALPYSYSEWIFGDGSRETVRMMSNTVSPVQHAYGISGTYLVTLRNYSGVGCYKEVTERVVVGKGYNVLVPNAFSPNGDLINDTFRVLFSGFSSVKFSVYDNRGNLLYVENLEEPNPDIPQGIALKGWDGKNAPPSPNFIYRFEGYTPTEPNPIIKSGTFILLQ